MSVPYGRSIICLISWLLILVNYCHVFSFRSSSPVFKRHQSSPFLLSSTTAESDDVDKSIERTKMRIQSKINQIELPLVRYPPSISRRFAEGKLEIRRLNDLLDPPHLATLKILKDKRSFGFLGFILQLESIFFGRHLRLSNRVLPTGYSSGRFEDNCPIYLLYKYSYIKFARKYDLPLPVGYRYEDAEDIYSNLISGKDDEQTSQRDKLEDIVGLTFQDAIRVLGWSPLYQADILANPNRQLLFERELYEIMDNLITTLPQIYKKYVINHPQSNEDTENNAIKVEKPWIETGSISSQILESICSNSDAVDEHSPRNFWKPCPQAIELIKSIYLTPDSDECNKLGLPYDGGNHLVIMTNLPRYIAQRLLGISSFATLFEELNLPISHLITPRVDVFDINMNANFLEQAQSIPESLILNEASLSTSELFRLKQEQAQLQSYTLANFGPIYQTRQFATAVALLARPSYLTVVIDRNERNLMLAKKQDFMTAAITGFIL
jgi:hypothetical protein